MPNDLIQALEKKLDRKRNERLLIPTPTLLPEDYEINHLRRRLYRLYRWHIKQGDPHVLLAIRSLYQNPDKAVPQLQARLQEADDSWPETPTLGSDSDHD